MICGPPESIVKPPKTRSALAALTLGQQRPEIDFDRLHTLMARHLKTQLLGGPFENVCDAFAVELAIVEDKDPLEPQALRQFSGGSTLDVVGRKRAEIVDFAGRAIDAGFPWRIARLGQTGVGVGDSHLRHTGLVGDRHADLRRTTIVWTDIDHGIGVGDRLLGILSFDGAIPATRDRRGIIEIHHRNFVPRCHTTRVLDGQIDSALHGGAFRNHHALHRPARIQLKGALRLLAGEGRDQAQGQEEYDTP